MKNKSHSAQLKYIILQKHPAVILYEAMTIKRLSQWNV